jgi:hypothetical protein
MASETAGRLEPFGHSWLKAANPMCTVTEREQEALDRRD